MIIYVLLLFVSGLVALACICLLINGIMRKQYGKWRIFLPILLLSLLLHVFALYHYLTLSTEYIE